MRKKVSTRWSLRLNPRMMSDGVPSGRPNHRQKQSIEAAWLARAGWQAGWQKQELIPDNGIEGGWSG